MKQQFDVKSAGLGQIPQQAYPGSAAYLSTTFGAALVNIMANSDRLRDLVDQLAGHEEQAPKAPSEPPPAPNGLLQSLELQITNLCDLNERMLTQINRLERALS